VIGFLIGLGCWITLGLVIYFMKVFVYCRGPKHYMDMNVLILKTAKSPITEQIIKQRTEVGDGTFVLGAFLIAGALGPLIALDFIRFALLINKCIKIQETQNKNGG
jgi:hypothetical protein